MTAFTDGYWSSRDGLRLHYRDYAGPPELPPLLCLPGLSRNARDFATLAGRQAAHRRVIVAELRGRGESAYAKDPMTYNPVTYADDIELLVAQLRLARFAIVGTSLGGIIAMLLAAADSQRLTGVVLNDIGPVIDPAGLTRIRGYIGRGASWPTWLHAGRYLAEGNGDVYPDYAIDDWIAMAKRLGKLTPAGRVVLDYDMKIAEPLRVAGAEAPADLWQFAMALVPVPVLLLRGERSDLLSEETAGAMAERLPKLQRATVPRVGHAPTLDEPEAVAAIDAFLAKAI